MVRWILRGIGVTFLLAFLLAVSGVAYVWHLGNEAMNRATTLGWFEVASADTPMTVFETTVQQAFFREEWNRRAFPCRTAGEVWATLTNNRARYSGMRVSTVLSNPIAFEEFEPDRTFESHLRRASLGCHLDSRFDDVVLLRIHLKRAWFGKDLVGADAASWAIFGKPVANLDSEEAVRLTALYYWPRLQETPEEWDERTEWVRERLRQKE